jgi:lysophospholipase L1-like esterase
MNRLQIDRLKSAYLGVFLVAAGLLFKPLVELSLVADGQVESSAYLALIYGFQIVALVSGAYLLLRRPAIRGRVPGKTELGLLAFSIIGTFVFLEVGARLWLNYLATPEQHDRYVLYTTIDPEDLAFTPHHYLPYYPTPNYRKGGTFHNSLGYRNGEFPAEKPDGVFRIVALGGSSTYDVRIEDNEKTFTAQLEKLLREEFGYENVEVINAGVPGFNSWEMLINLEFRVLDLDPDLAILYEGTNDVHARLVEPAAYRGDNSGRRGPWHVPPVSLWERSALLRIISRAGNFTRQVSVDDFVAAPTYMSWPYESRIIDYGADPGEILEMNPPVYFRRNLENMIAVAEENDVDVLLATWASSPLLNDYASREDYRQGFAENNRVVTEVANSHSVSLFDYAAVMSQDASYWADGRHANEAGASLKAGLFAEFIDMHGLITH